MSERLANITAAVERSYGRPVKHLESIPLKVENAAKEGWEGVVEVFHIPETQHSVRCYAWMYVDSKDETRYATVLKSSPHIMSPTNAVLAWLAHLMRTDGI